MILAFRNLQGRDASANRLRQHRDKLLHLVINETVPQRPAVVIVNDVMERRRWTISIARGYEFPLRPEVYEELCQEASVVFKLLRGGRKHGTTDTLPLIGTRASMQKGDAFMDVAEAEQHGFVPGPGPLARREKGPVPFKDSYRSKYQLELSGLTRGCAIEA